MIDFHAGNDKNLNNWNIVLSPAMQRDVFKMYEEIEQLSSRSLKTEEAILDMHNFITVVLERIELHNEFRAFKYGTAGRHQSSNSFQARFDTMVAVGGGAVTPNIHTNPESLRITHDNTEEMFYKQSVITQGVTLKASVLDQQQPHSFTGEEPNNDKMNDTPGI